VGGSVQISLWLAEEHPCSDRTVRAGRLFAEKSERVDLWDGGCSAEVDASGAEVSGRSFLEALRGRGRLSPWREGGGTRDFLLYLNGHGGDGYFKFRDSDEVSADMIADALAESWRRGLFSRAWLILDTCQAATLFDAMDRRGIPGLTHLSTSDKGLSSYAADYSSADAVALADGFIATVGRHLARLGAANATLRQLVDLAPARLVLSQVVTGGSSGSKGGDIGSVDQTRNASAAAPLPLAPFLTARFPGIVVIPAPRGGTGGAGPADWWPQRVGRREGRREEGGLEGGVGRLDDALTIRAGRGEDVLVGRAGLQRFIRTYLPVVVEAVVAAAFLWIAVHSVEGPCGSPRHAGVVVE
jgi:Peptidase C13 family